MRDRRRRRHARSMDESVDKAEWVGDNAADLVEGSPNVTNGKVEAQS